MLYPGDKDKVGQRANGADHAQLYKTRSTNTQTKYTVEGGGTGRTKTPRKLS